MDKLATLQRVTEQLKADQGITVKALAQELEMNYNYLSRQVSGNTKLTPAVYEKVMEFARLKGIDTTTYRTRTQSQHLAEPPSDSHFLKTLDGQKYEIHLWALIDNNEISGVRWRKEPVA